jgi:hypothetical protein
VRRLLLVAVVVCGCTKTTPSADVGAGARARATPSSAASSVAAPAPDAATPSSAATDQEAGAGGGEPELPEPSLNEIASVLFLDPATGLSACPSGVPADARIRCLYDERYKGDAKAASLAHEMYLEWRIVAGVEAAHTMDGGYRGMIRIEPTVPVGKDRRHLDWVVTAFRDFDRFFDELWRWGKEHGARAPSRPYRFRAITLRFARSINVNRPSAWAHDWTIAYNVNGSINLSADQVRETMFHEIFHLNDSARGAERGGSDRPREASERPYWSARALAEVFDGVVKRCGTAIPCLGPYTPNDTIVRGGTYYAFQPGNGVVEYAAELALRYYREQRNALRSLADTHGGKKFKCGPPENARAWALMKDEFFGGVDATPACP